MKLLAFAVQVALISEVIVLSPVITTDITVQDVPTLRPHSWVTDSINILSPKTKAEINRIADQLEEKNSCEIMVVAVPEPKGYRSPGEFSLAWFNHWTIGKQGLENGVLLMYIRGNDHPGETPLVRIEIVAGRGIRSMLPPAKLVSLERDIEPRLNKRDYDGAMLIETQEVANALQNYQPKSQPKVSPSSLQSLLVVSFVMVANFLIFIYKVRRGSHSHNESMGNYSGGGGSGGTGGGHGGGGHGG